MPAGRPTDYKPEYCAKVIELGALGMSVVEIAVSIGVSRNTLQHTWTKAHPEFLTAMETARDASQAWWENKGREYILNEPGKATLNTGLYSRSMAARFPDDWREKTAQEVTGSNGGPIELSVTRRILKPDQ